MTRSSPPSPISAFSVLGSSAASISTCVSVARQRSRYALLSIVPTATLLMMRCDSSWVATGPPTWTLPVYSLMSPPFRCVGKPAGAHQSVTRGTSRRPAEQVTTRPGDHDRRVTPVGQGPAEIRGVHGDVVGEAADRVGEQPQPEGLGDVAVPVPEAHFPVGHPHPRGAGGWPPAGLSAWRASSDRYCGVFTPVRAQVARLTSESALRAMWVSTCPTVQPGSMLGRRACSSGACGGGARR